MFKKIKEAVQEGKKLFKRERREKLNPKISFAMVKSKRGLSVPSTKKLGKLWSQLIVVFLTSQSAVNLRQWLLRHGETKKFR